MFETRRDVICRAGEWTKLIHTQFAQLPKSWTIRVQAPSDQLLGEMEEVKSSWIFPGKPIITALPVEAVLHRGYWNTFYKVRVRPNRTITISVLGSWL